MYKEFKKFILRGNVVDLAVGIVIGAAFTSVVNSIVKDLITPLVASIYHQQQFSNASFSLRGSKFLYGDFVNALISFIIVAAVVFFLVVQPINKLNELAMRGKGTDEPSTKKCDFCFSVIPREATRCPNCTSQLGNKKAA